MTASALQIEAKFFVNGLAVGHPTTLDLNSHLREALTDLSAKPSLKNAVMNLVEEVKG
ncbi:hypothetical protein [Deinococcus sp. QL22]|uniref:hypothetical protein n=1 Tax=Deinococcus sp. QL22 TaxID=2939437 RepID=UPI00201739DF|nr:hypothetical protein [Deinococcus sp. QL22]UQN06314.1 hypothetical protein M1R55_15865 [Deinococcus sp. QL22]